MDFTPATQNGIIPPSETGILQSKLGLAVSSSSTVYGNELILKAISDAAMYKTEPVTFYKRIGSTATSIGTGTWISTNTCALVTSAIGTGTYQLYANWPGEGMFAPQSTEGAPIDFVVEAGYPLNATFSNTVNPPSGNVVVGEGSVTFTVTVNTSTQLTDTLSFYVGNTFYGQSNFVNNVATLTIPNLPEGNLSVRTIWPGGTIDGVLYEGFTYEIPYTVAAGSDLSTTVSFFPNPAYGVVGEGQLYLDASINTSTSISTGSIYFYAGDTQLAVKDVVNNHASIAVLNPLSTGTYTVYARYDGNPNSHPRYLPINSSTSSFEVKVRDTAILTLTDFPDPTIYDLDDVVLTATLETTKTPSGTVAFYDGNDILGASPLVNNVAIFTATNLTVGVHSLRASYLGSNTAPKFFGTYSEYITSTVVSSIPYPGTMGLTSNKSSIYALSDNASVGLTLTGSVNTQTLGSVNYYEYSIATSTATSGLTTTTSELFVASSQTGTSVSRVTGTNITTVTNGLNYTEAIANTTVVTTYNTSTTGLNVIVPKIIYVEQKHAFNNIFRNRGIITQEGLTQEAVYACTFKIISSIDMYKNNVWKPAPGSIVASIASNFNGQANVPIYSFRIDFISGIPPGNYTGMVIGYYNTDLRAAPYVSTATSYTTTATTVKNYTWLTSSTFTGSNITTASVNLNPFVSKNPIKIIAQWDGHKKNVGAIPYQEVTSNIFSQPVNIANVVLSSNTTTRSEAQSNTFVISANTSNIVTNTLKLYSGTTNIATASIPANTSTTSITVPAGLIPVTSYVSVTTSTSYQINIGTSYFGSSNEYLNSYGSIINNSITSEFLYSLDYFVVQSNSSALKNIKFKIIPGTVTNPGSVNGVKIWGFLFAPSTPITYTPSTAPDVGTFWITTFRNIINDSTIDITAELTTTSISTVSNALPMNIVARVQPVSFLNLSTGTYQYYTQEGLTNTSAISATFNVISPYKDRQIDGNVTLYGNGSLITTASINTSAISIDFIPSSFSAVSTDLTILGVYSGDEFLISSSATNTMSIVKNKPILTMGTKSYIPNGGYEGQYFGPVDLICTFPIKDFAPSEVSWYKNGTFVVSTPVINGVAYLNNTSLVAGTYAFSVSYTETGRYTGTSDYLQVIEAPARWAPADLQPSVSASYNHVGYMPPNIPNGGYLGYSVIFTPAVTNPPSYVSIKITPVGRSGYGEPYTLTGQPTGSHTIAIGIGNTADPNNSNYKYSCKIEITVPGFGVYSF